MRPILTHTVVTVTCLLAWANSAIAAFTIRLNSDDFQIDSVFNDVNRFDFAIDVASPLSVAAFTDPNLAGVSYEVFGDLSTSPTPSGFPAFLLRRTLPGDTLYDQSPDATLRFTIDATADLTDGLQISELAGPGVVFELNARELDQNPGRYHPPRLILNADGTGVLENSNNRSVFPNPQPPIGSGDLVDVTFGEEYRVDLTFDPNLTIAAAIPEPGIPAAALIGLLATLRSRRRTRLKTE